MVLEALVQVPSASCLWTGSCSSFSNGSDPLATQGPSTAELLFIIEDLIVSDNVCGGFSPQDHKKENNYINGLDPCTKQTNTSKLVIWEEIVKALQENNASAFHPFALWHSTAITTYHNHSLSTMTMAQVSSSPSCCVSVSPSAPSFPDLGDLGASLYRLEASPGSNPQPAASHPKPRR